jgi:hypothetical protein
VVDGALGLRLDHRVSRVLKGYWQRPLLPKDQRQIPEIRWGRVFGLVYINGKRIPRNEILVDPETEALFARWQRGEVSNEELIEAAVPNR